MNSEMLHTMLIVYLVIAWVAAMLYLRQRWMPFGVYALWGFFALLIPAFGPFVAIALRPGRAAHRAVGCSCRCGYPSKRNQRS